MSLMLPPEAEDRNVIYIVVHRTQENRETMVYCTRATVEEAHLSHTEGYYAASGDEVYVLRFKGVEVPNRPGGEETAFYPVMKASDAGPIA